MLQPNAIYLGDSYKLIKEIKSKSIDLVVCDPPYEFDSNGGGGAFGSKNHAYHKEVSEKLNYGITDEILIELERVMKKTNIYIFCNKNQLLQYLTFYKDKNVDLLVWNKTNTIPTINQKYLSDLEYIVFARDKGVKMYNTHETSSKLFQTTTNKADKQLYDHPTIKPEHIIETLIINSSKVDDIVLDPFLGSGTTAVVAKKLGRKYIGIEIEENYFNTAEDRLKGITKIDREIQKSGQQSIFDIIDENI